MGTKHLRSVIGTATIAIVSLAACGDSPDTPAGAETSAMGPVATTDAPSPTEPDTTNDTGMAWRTVEVVDPSRPTDEVRGPDGEVVLDAADSRTIPVELLYEGGDGGGEGAPAAATTPRPLVVWMNGLGGKAEVGDPILSALYEAGYVVAAPNSPEVSAPAGSPGDFPELPADVSAVIDALLHPADGVGDDLSPYVISSNIGLAGQSIGSSTVRALAFHDCCRDDRVGAVVSIGSHTGFRFDDADFDYSGIPLLLIHGEADEISPLEEAEKILAASVEPARLLVLPDADHLEPVYGGTESEAGSRAIEAIVAFFDTHLLTQAAGSALEDFAADLPAGTWRSPAG